jgi:hypothetical protein
VIRCEADQRARRNGSTIDKSRSWHAGRQKRVTDCHGGVQAPAESIDIEHHEGGAIRSGLIDYTLYKGGETHVDHPLDGDHVHNGASADSAFLGGGRQTKGGEERNRR